jgi:hypothetical protein
MELVEIGETRRTDANGIAVFTVSVGDYVLRAYDINQGGPAAGG